MGGVEAGPWSQPPNVGAVRADLPQQARLTERAVAGQERVVERADPLRDDPVEAPDPADHVRVHSLTIVREMRLVRRAGSVAVAVGESAARAGDAGRYDTWAGPAAGST